MNVSDNNKNPVGVAKQFGRIIDDRRLYNGPNRVLSEIIIIRIFMTIIITLLMFYHVTKSNQKQLKHFFPLNIEDEIFFLANLKHLINNIIQILLHTRQCYYLYRQDLQLFI